MSMAMPPTRAGRPSGPGMANFAVRLVHGPNWDQERPIRGQAGWEEHAAFMDRLVDDGFIILGGPVGAQTVATKKSVRWEISKVMIICPSLQVKTRNMTNQPT